jgi:putative transposase
MLYEVKVAIKRWLRHYNAVRPHSSLKHRPPAPETILPPTSGLAYAALLPAKTLATSTRVLS